MLGLGELLRIVAMIWGRRDKAWIRTVASEVEKSKWFGGLVGKLNGRDGIGYGGWEEGHIFWLVQLMCEPCSQTLMTG